MYGCKLALVTDTPALSTVVATVMFVTAELLVLFPELNARGTALPEAIV